MTFAIDSSDFFKTSLQEIVICKNNNMCIFFNLSFDLSIFSLKPNRNGRTNIFLQPKVIKEY